MLAEFSIYPTDETHLSKEVARIIKVLEEVGLDYRLGPMGTAVEGNWDQIMSAIHRCHLAVAGHHARVITTITIDDRKNQPHHLDDMVGAVDEQLGHSAKRVKEREKLVVQDF